MKKLILIFLLSFVSLYGQRRDNPNWWWVWGAENILWAIDLDGSTEYASDATPANLDLNDTNRVKLQADIDFEDSLGNWAGTGNHSIDTTSVSPLTGTYSGMIVSPLGDELTINGVFDADSSWGKGTGWSIAAGVASCDGSQPGATNLDQNILLAYTRYQIVFTVSNYSAGNIKFLSDGGSSGGAVRSANGTYTEVFNTLTTGQNLYMQGNVDFVGDIDNVSAKVYAGDATNNYASLPAANFTALEHNKKYTFQMQAMSADTADLEAVIGNATDEVDLVDATKGTFDSGTNDWSVYGTNTIANVDNSLEVTYVENVQGAFTYLKSSQILTEDQVLSVRYKVTLDAKVNSGSSVDVRVKDGNGFVAIGTVTSTSFVEYSQYWTSLNNIGDSYLNFNSMGAGEIVYIDNIVVQKVGKTFVDVDPSTTETLVWNFEYDTTGVGELYYTLDGTNDELTGGTSVISDNSFSTLVRFKTSANENASLFGEFDASNDGFRINTRSNGILWAQLGKTVAGENSVYDTDASTNYANGSYHTWGATYDGAYIRTYYDGTLVDSTASTRTLSTSSGLYLGSLGGASEYFDGDISHTYLYDGVLTDAQMSSLHSGTSASSALYSMEPSQISNFEWVDNSGNSNNLTVNGATVPLFPDLQLYTNQPDTVYMDNMDVSQAYDRVYQAWIYPDVDNAYQGIIGTSSATPPAFGFYVSNIGGVHLNIISSYANRNANASTSVTTGIWQNVAVVYNVIDGDWAFYTNGVADGTTDGDVVGVLRDVPDLRIGDIWAGTGFNGYIGETQIIRFDNIEDAGFGASDILTNYNNGTKGKNMPSNYTGGTIVGWWKWKGGTNALMLEDVSSSSNDLVGTNVTQADDQTKVKGGYK